MWQIARRLACNKIYSRNLLKNHEAILGVLWKPYFARGKQDNSNDENFKISRLFEPVPMQQSSDSNVGAELTGQLNKSDILRVLNTFSQKKENRDLCKEYGLDGIISTDCLLSTHCIDAQFDL